MMILLVIVTLLLRVSGCIGNPYPNICSDDQQIIEVVDSDNIDSTATTGIITVKNLTAALLHASNYTCIVLLDSTENLKDSLVLTNIHKFTLASVSSTPITILCHDQNANKGTGLSFLQSENIKFLNVSFRSCGGERTIKSYELKDINITTTLFFEKTRNLHLSNVHILDHDGLAITLIDSGGIVSINNVVIRNTNNFHSSGVFVKYTGKDDYSSFNTISVTSTLFQNLTMLKPPDSNKVHSSDYPFGTGAFSVVFENRNCHNNTLNVSASHFLSNIGSFGGAMSIRLSNESNGNKILITNTVFSYNVARKYGGAICMFSKNKDEHNTIALSNVKFTENTGKVGGAIFSWHPVSTLSCIDVTLSGCIFNGSSASIGSDLLGVHTTFNLTGENINFLGNKQYHDVKDRTVLKPYGSVSLYGSILNVETQVKISNGLNTGVVLVNSKVTIRGSISKLTLHKNSGKNGGGIAMFTKSKISVIEKAVLLFNENSAEGNGGGLFASTSALGFEEDTQSMSRHITSCFISADNESNVKFINNRAYKDSGYAIYASSLKRCVSNPEDVKNVFRNFTFSPSDQTIATNPVNILVTPQQWKIEPGKTFKPTIELVDERGYYVTSTIDVVVNKTCLQDDVNIIHKHFVVTSQTAALSFTGTPNMQCTFNVSLIASVAVSRIITNRELSTCSKFYTFDTQNKTCICRQQYEWESHISHCFQNELYILRNYWFPKGEENKSFKCPDQYCKEFNEAQTINGFDILFDQSNQCNQNRSQESILCSKCKQDFAVSITDNLCIDCSKAWLDWKLYLVGSIVLHAIAVFGIIVLNREVYAGYINPVIYSYKLLEYFLVDLNLTHIVDEPVTMYVQNRLLPSICFTKHFDNLDKLWALFGLSFLPMLAYLLDYWLFYRKGFCRCAKWIPRSRDAYYRSLTSIVFLTYFRVIDFAFRALHYEMIDRYRVYHYAEEVYFSPKHIPLAVLAIACLLLLLLYDILLILNSTSVQANLRCKMIFSIPVQPIMMALKIGYKTSTSFSKDRTWFAPIYMMIFTAYMAVGEYYDASARSCFLAITGVILLVLFTYCKPYVSNTANRIEIFLLGNIVVVGVLIDGVSGMFVYERKFKIFICIFCYIPAVCLITCALYSLKKFLPPIQSRWCLMGGVESCYGGNRNSQKDDVVVAPPLIIQQK